MTGGGIGHLLCWEQHERDGTWHAWVSWVQSTGDPVRHRHHVVSVRAGTARAARTALRRAARAAPGFRSAAGARAALIAATRSRGMEARDPCRSVTKDRNRSVLVAFRGTVPP